ncbi:hypothetical protein VC83_06089 [Pseudogymnoascus destructans]|uniref:Transcription initiation factor IIF subunit alpha n=2 Tax=Pseudogymnoascus destructans TaxID=655981 RepID=L8FXL1_PSED2|nr:uncharacterized protein VC83_06089 [Pseudogymnoascus destructans]ELR05299.1 hypothetical protein GMDG_07282 [Pseudogymnoascus destructans 20631-21]OAF58765.1 hypothetical protein VC83_06089 [Pseudogymnoascus destructans]
MSASPAGITPNGTPTPNSGGQPPKIIRRAKADPFATYKKPVVRPQAAPRSRQQNQNGLTALNKPPPLPRPLPRYPGNNRAADPAGPISNAPPQPQLDFTRKSNIGEYEDFALTTTKRAMREGLRYHIARFASKKKVDPTNSDDFIKPVSLHRRDPRQPPAGKVAKDEDTVVGEPIDDKEREKQEIARAAKEAQRAADLAQIAPSGNNASALAAKKVQSFKNEKTTQVHRTAQTEEEMKESDLRYEEALPWHLEDAENKQTWVGNYEAALSDTNVIFVIDGTNFRMVPIEKWYKFTPKNQFKTLTIEEAEAEMNKKSKANRWVMHADQQNQEAAERQRGIQAMAGLYSKVKGERPMPKSEARDHDDLDITDDLFQDDDEQATVEPENDEDTKLAAEKIKREQLGANLFGDADEEEVEEEFKEEAKEKEMKKRLGKSLRKSLRKREKNYTYESDSSNPYSSSSGDETTDDEKQAEEDRKKDEEAKLKEKEKLGVPKIASGASTKGTTTPIGRPRSTDPHKKHNHLKRAGSPNLSASETSGNESTRKKHKKKHMLSSSQPTGTSTRRSGSPHPSSSAPAGGVSPRKSSIVKLHVSSSRLSDIQANAPHPAMSDSEMSDGAGGKRKSGIKLRLGTSASPSRAGSPTNGSRAGSPAQAQGAASPIRPIMADEIAAAIPAEGIAIGMLLKIFSGRIKGNGKDKEDREKFIKLVKENSVFSQEDKLLRPRAT